MDEMEGRIAFVNAQVVCALAEIAAMQAENNERERRGEAAAWNFTHFMAVQDKYLIGHNAVISYLTGAA